MEFFSLPTNEYYFGKGAIEGLAEVLKKHGYKKAMLAYGGGSIKKIGLYQQVLDIAKKRKVALVEYGNIQPNPLNDHTTKGGEFARANKVDVIIAAGGGSTVDAAKVMGVVATNPDITDCWDLAIGKKKYKKAPLPVISIITLAGTASENNTGSVITNPKEQLKFPIFSVGPVAAIEDPTYTFSVSPYQTASGIFDCFSHLLESYFIRKEGDDFEWTNQYLMANLRVLLKYSPVVMKKPNDYEARANLLFTASFSLNGLNGFCFESADWTVHDLEHSISAVYDVPHGAGLALITPTYMSLKIKTDKLFKARTERLAKEVFGKKTAEQGVAEIASFIKNVLKLPVKYTDFDVIKKPLDKKEIQNLTNHLRSTDKKLALQVFSAIPNN